MQDAVRPTAAGTALAVKNAVRNGERAMSPALVPAVAVWLVKPGRNAKKRNQETEDMARELGPKGVHVAHVILDGMIAQEGDDSAADAVLQPAAIAESYYQLHRQARGAWTHEIDLRPFGEKF